MPVTFLPIVERELRSASRKRLTFWTRLFAAILSVGLGFLIMFVYFVSPGGDGRALLTALGGFCFLFALVTAVFTSADCISRERREGTLGFLFLTDLRGYDVIAGKFVSASLTAFYGLLAALPVLGISLLMGGVTGPEFRRVALSLLNALFFAHAVGIWISCHATDDQRSMGQTIGALTLITLVAPALALGLGGLPGLDWVSRLAWLSPGYCWLQAAEVRYMFDPAPYWGSLATVHATAWLLLIGASLRLPRKWREPETPPPTKKQVARSLDKTAPQQIRRRKLIDQNPVYWLIQSRSSVRAWAWVFGLAGMAVHVGFLIVMWTEMSANARGMAMAPMSGMLAAYVVWPLATIFKALFGWQACRFFTDARRTGGIDLLLSTPLSGRQIIDGQWKNLWRVFLAPGLCLVVGPLIPAVVITVLFWMDFNQLTANPDMIMGAIMSWLMSAGSHLVTMGTFIADILALGWLGMYFGLTLRKPQQAAPWTLACVLFFPIFVMCIPGAKIAIDVILIIVFRGVMLTRFREKALPDYHPGRMRRKPTPAAASPNASAPPPQLPSGQGNGPV